MTTTEAQAPRHLTLPPDEELVEAELLIQKAHDAMESIAWGTEGFSRLFEGDRVIPDVLPTTADVGRLYLFAHYLEGKAEEFATMSKEIVATLPLLGEMPGNVGIWQARGANDDD